MNDASSSSGAAYQKLPPGWDCKYDQATGNCYYINYFTKAMQLEDPRARYKQLQNERCSTESIPMQHMVTQQTSAASAAGIGVVATATGSGGIVNAAGNASPYHVYPSNSLTAVRAFQERHMHANLNTNPSSLHNMSSSPLLSTRGQLEMSSPLPFARSQTPRLGHGHGQNHMSRRSTIQETSFSNQIDTDAVVTKIQNMFPTAGENHIRLLLKRYYNREAVVISALQVEKHPVTMPGPFVTPPAQRHLFHSNSTFYMTPPTRRLDMGASRIGVGAGTAALSGFNSRTASPIPGGRFGSIMSMQSGGAAIPTAIPATATAAIYHGSPRFHVHGEQWRSSPKPHSSPKMKLRYMKNIFPKADETLLLDILANADNNVQTASQKLISMGYAKRDFVPAKANRPPEMMQQQQQQENDVRIIPLRPKEYTVEEKETMQSILKTKYPQIAERIILMALESVNYCEDRATQILQIVHEEDEQQHAKKHSSRGGADVQATKLREHLGPQSVTDGATHATDSILTVVLETTTNTATSDTSINLKNKHISAKKHRLPAINVTTPTTATTQIILSSSSPIDYEIAPQPPNSEQHHNQTINHISPTSDDDIITTSPPSSNSYASPTHSPTRYERLTTKSILARSSGYASANIGGIINGYLHGSSSTYSSYTTTTTATTSKKSSLSLSRSSTSSSSSSSSAAAASSIAGKLTAAAISQRERTKSNSLKNSQRSISLENDAQQQQQNAEFKSIIKRMSTLGHNSELAKGANENLLLADYITWNGANPSNNNGQKQLATGADSSILNERSYKPNGRNPELCKGAKAGLAKGSIYKSANIKCN